jgi:hypothetical protein
MNHQKPTTDPFTDPDINETTLTTEMPLGQRTSTLDVPSADAPATSEARILELEKELDESKKREETLKNHNISLKTRIKSLKRAIKKENAQIENAPALTLDLHISNHQEGSADEAEAIVLDDVDAGEQAGEQ